MVGPSWLKEGRLAHIKEATRTRYRVHNVDCMAVDWSRDGEAPPWGTGVGDEGSEGSFLAKFTRTSWGLVEALGGGMDAWYIEGVACQDGRQGRKLPVGRED